MRPICLCFLVTKCGYFRLTYVSGGKHYADLFKRFRRTDRQIPEKPHFHASATPNVSRGALHRERGKTGHLQRKGR